MSPAETAQQIKSLALTSGFDDCRIAPAQEAPHNQAFFQWLAEGKHGEMAWMARNPERRADPRIVLPECKSVVMLALNYYPGDTPITAPPITAPAPQGKIARYAWNDDYHDIILPKLQHLDTMMQTLGGTQRYYVDTGPVLERDFANLAGLGWNGKSTLQIHPKLGTWFFLAAILTTLDAQNDAPGRDHCGKCTRCMVACPTQAITAPHQLDARLCISYLTIEFKGSIPSHLRPLIGDRIYGCDACLDACPWNRFAQTSREISLLARPTIFSYSLRDFLAFSEEQFRTVFRASPIKRIKRSRFLRNVAVAIGNVGSPDDLPALAIAKNDPDPLIAEHAAWATEQIALRFPKKTYKHLRGPKPLF